MQSEDLFRQPYRKQSEDFLRPGPTPLYAFQAIITAGDKLIHVQVSENYRGTPGTGETNWNAYKKGLEAINYKGTVTIESFTPDNKELAGAVCFWHPMAENQDDFAIDGLRFLKKWAAEKNNIPNQTILKSFANGGK